MLVSSPTQKWTHATLIKMTKMLSIHLVLYQMPTITLMHSFHWTVGIFWCYFKYYWKWPTCYSIKWWKQKALDRWIEKQGLSGYVKVRLVAFDKLRSIAAKAFQDILKIVKHKTFSLHDRQGFPQHVIYTFYKQENQELMKHVESVLWGEVYSSRNFTLSQIINKIEVEKDYVHCYKASIAKRQRRISKAGAQITMCRASFARYPHSPETVCDRTLSYYLSQWKSCLSKYWWSRSWQFCLLFSWVKKSLSLLAIARGCLKFCECRYKALSVSRPPPN